MNNSTLEHFLEKAPPGTKCRIENPLITDDRGFERVNAPKIEILCPTCNGDRIFEHPKHQGGYLSDSGDNTYHNLIYVCRNCKTSEKAYSIHCEYNDLERVWHFTKIGELPAFGPPIPSKANKLAGPDRELLLKGRRCENQGMGVGAFVYYRRVVENQKSRIFDEIIKVSTHLKADQELIDSLEKAKLESQFTKAIEEIKGGIPQSLYVNGENPLTLLHSALSCGVHELDDKECLELAESVRIILYELSERLAQAMKDEAELNDAVKRLNAIKTRKRSQ